MGWPATKASPLIVGRRATKAALAIGPGDVPRAVGAVSGYLGSTPECSGRGGRGFSSTASLAERGFVVSVIPRPTSLGKSIGGTRPTGPIPCNEHSESRRGIANSLESRRRRRRRQSSSRVSAGDGTRVVRRRRVRTKCSTVRAASASPPPSRIPRIAEMVSRLRGLLRVSCAGAIRTHEPGLQLIPSVSTPPEPTLGSAQPPGVEPRGPRPPPWRGPPYIRGGAIACLFGAFVSRPPCLPVDGELSPYRI